MYLIPPQRFSGHAIGILLGYVLRTFNGKKFTKTDLAIGYFVSLTLFAASVAIMLANLKYHLLYQAIFAAVASILYCLSVSWIVMASHFGHSSKFDCTLKNFILFFVSDFFFRALEWRFFKISTNIAFGIYLVQFTVFTFNVGVTRGAVQSTIFGSFVRDF